MRIQQPNTILKESQSLQIFQSKMKFLLVFTIFVNFYRVETLSRDLKSSLLSKAISDITKSLALRDHMISIVVSSGNDIGWSISESAAGIPHALYVKSFDTVTSQYHL